MTGGAVVRGCWNTVLTALQGQFILSLSRGRKGEVLQATFYLPVKREGRGNMAAFAALMETDSGNSLGEQQQQRRRRQQSLPFLSSQ